MGKPSKDEILSASAGWVAVILNILPGLGAGYLYQRRWKEYWITGIISALWLTIGMFAQLLIDPSDPAPDLANTDLLVFLGLIAIAFITAWEAGLSVKQARELLEY